MFRAIASEDFPPFGKFEIDFLEVPNKPPELAEVHLFTGVNGTGKTRLLTLFAAMLGNVRPLQRRMRGSAKQPIEISAKHLPHDRSRPWVRMQTTAEGATWVSGGEIRTWCERVPAFAYNGTAYLSDAGIKLMAGTPRPERQACLSFSRPEGYSALLLQAIANLVLQAGIEARRGDETKRRATRNVRMLEQALGEITGQPCVFNVTPYEPPRLLVDWGHAELPFDVLPDGVRSIIGWLVDAVVMLDAWVQGKGNLTETEAVFLLDEIESHLHPAWQRKILPAFQRMFPKAQIFVATHSPFVISSLNCGWIHRLTMQGDKVTVMKPSPASAGDSYISVLEDIMGLDEWFDPETEKLLKDFRGARDRAYGGSQEAKAEAVALADKIGARSLELKYTMGRELSQMERQLGKGQGK